ncbi:hypothetical protein GE061_001199 [Apolygus lucorum]|uniref:Uncharacterized protein n=1 Tax=Apolygus lucorum TaxID=248454 RepID=A0A8S9Y7Z5_APOLU|nr:hypothetical protein GE061_001199 [Apolygus lucorum]
MRSTELEAMIGSFKFVFESSSKSYPQTYLIFKLAYKLALDGLKCLIITKPIARSSFGKILNERQWLSPDVLELIQFRQFKSATCLIDWCHCFLNGQAMPHAILLNGFEDFCDVTEFLAYYLCACLIDTAKHLTKCLSEKNINFHLILAFKSSTYNNRPAFFDMFRNILSAEEVVKQFNVNTH